MLSGLSEARVPVPVLAGVAVTYLEPDAGVAWDITGLYRGAVPLAPSNRQEFADGALATLTGLPRWYYLEGDGTLVLGPVPASDEVLTATVTVRPADDAVEVDDVLLSVWSLPIAAGARAWVRRNYGQWVDAVAEAEDAAIFAAGVGQAKRRLAVGGSPACRRVRHRPFN